MAKLSFSCPAIPSGHTFSPCTMFSRFIAIFDSTPVCIVRVGATGYDVLTGTLPNYVRFYNSGSTYIVVYTASTFESCTIIPTGVSTITALYNDTPVIDPDVSSYTLLNDVSSPVLLFNNFNFNIPATGSYGVDISTPNKNNATGLTLFGTVRSMSGVSDTLAGQILIQYETELTASLVLFHEISNSLNQFSVSVSPGHLTFNNATSFEQQIRAVGFYTKNMGA